MYHVNAVRQRQLVDGRRRWLVISILMGRESKRRMVRGLEVVYCNQVRGP